MKYNRLYSSFTFKNSLFHHIDHSPAIANEVVQIWCSNGYIDRKMFPAIIVQNNDGSTDKIWFENGKLSRDNNPAVILKSKNIYAWYKNGKLSRDNKPAVIIDENKFHFNNGIIHRTHGPAISFKNGIKIWCVNGNILHTENSNNVNISEIYNNISSLGSIIEQNIHKEYIIPYIKYYMDRIKI